MSKMGRKPRGATGMRRKLQEPKKTTAGTQNNKLKGTAFANKGKMNAGFLAPKKKGLP